jgi:excisionase family DNA binding protein
MAYEFNGRPQVIERGGISIMWDPLPSPDAQMIIRRRVGAYHYERRIGPNGNLDVLEVATALGGANRSTIYRLLQSGHLRAVRDQGRLVIPRRDVERYIERSLAPRRGRKLGQRYSGS